MKKDGQFILFKTPEEFESWLFSQGFNRKITRIQQHHTYIPNYSTFKGNHFETLKSMDYYHETHGFSDIAQNITTFPDGAIGVCRPFNVMPAGILGANEGALCIENIGNFDVEQMTEEQSRTIVCVTRSLLKRFDLPVDTNSIIYHHWFDLNSGQRTNGLGVTKTCPGRNFFCGNTVEACNKYFIPLINSRPITIEVRKESKVLKKGDRNSEVSKLQEKLNIIGYNLVVDGDFGRLTETAVMDFQRNSKLEPDGIVGDATMAAIDKAVEAVNKPLDLQVLYSDLLARYEALKEKTKNYDILAGNHKKLISEIEVLINKYGKEENA